MIFITMFCNCYPFLNHKVFAEMFYSINSQSIATDRFGNTHVLTTVFVSLPFANENIQHPFTVWLLNYGMVDKAGIVSQETISKSFFSFYFLTNLS